MYQPSPFEPGIQAQRTDCQKRWDSIIKYLICQDKTFFDFGCAEGFFGFKALIAGAKHVTFVELDESVLEHARKTAVKHKLSDRSAFHTTFPEGSWDVGIYLDLIYHGSAQPPLEKFAESCKELYISPSGDGHLNNVRLELDLRPLFKSVEQIHVGFEGRKIYRCLR